MHEFYFNLYRSEKKIFKFKSDTNQLFSFDDIHWAVADLQ